MNRIFANNVSGTLGSLLPAAATTMYVDPAEMFPNPGADEFYALTLAAIDSNGVETDWEIVHVTEKAGTALTVLRGQEGTTAREWPPNTHVELRITADGIVTERRVKQIIGYTQIQLTSSTSSAVTGQPFYVTVGGENLVNVAISVLGGTWVYDPTTRVITVTPGSAPTVTVTVATDGAERAISLPVAVPQVAKPVVPHIIGADNPVGSSLRSVRDVLFAVVPELPDSPAGPITSVEFQLAADSDFTTGVVSRQPQAIRDAVRFDLNNGTYYLRWRAFGPYGATSPWSDALTIAADHGRSSLSWQSYPLTLPGPMARVWSSGAYMPDTVKGDAPHVAVLLSSIESGGSPLQHPPRFYELDMSTGQYVYIPTTAPYFAGRTQCLCPEAYVSPSGKRAFVRVWSDPDYRERLIGFVRTPSGWVEESAIWFVNFVAMSCFFVSDTEIIVGSQAYSSSLELSYMSRYTFDESATDPSQKWVWQSEFEYNFRFGNYPLLRRAGNKWFLGTSWYWVSTMPNEVSGAVFVHNTAPDGSVGSIAQIVLPPNVAGRVDYSFGEALSLNSDGSWMAVGSPLDEYALPGKPTDEYGSVSTYFQLSDGQYQFDSRLTPPELTTANYPWLPTHIQSDYTLRNFGVQVRFSNDGTTLLVCAYTTSNLSGTPEEVNGGHAWFLYKRVGGVWTLVDIYWPVGSGATGSYRGTSTAYAETVRILDSAATILSRDIVL